jgi:hypothetical protein
VCCDDKAESDISKSRTQLKVTDIREAEQRGGRDWNRAATAQMPNSNIQPPFIAERCSTSDKPRKQKSQSIKIAKT